MNTKLLKLLIVLIFIVSNVNAQEKNNLYSFYSKSLVTANNSNPINYYESEFLKYTQISLFGNTNFNNVKHNQTASEEQNLGINVNGIYKKNNTIFIGKLGYRRNYLSEIGFKHSNFYFNRNIAEETPFYLFTYGNGNWNNQDYTLNGQIIFPLISNKLFSGVKVNYKTAQFFRPQEPATRINYLDYNFGGSLIYKINQNHNLGIAFSFGKLNKEIDLDYFTIFNNIPSNINIYNSISFGYGAHIPAKSTRTKEQENNLKIETTYSYFSKHHLINVSLGFTNRDNNFLDVSSGRPDGVSVGTFNSKKFQANLYWLNKAKQQQLTINSNYTLGENFRVATQGKNYDATLLNINAKYQFFKDNKGVILYDYGFKTALNSLEKTEYQIVNSSKYTTLYLGGFYGKDFRLKDNKKIFIQTELGGQFSLNDNAFFSINDPLITQVEVPKFHLQTTTQLAGNIKIGHQTIMKNDTNLSFELGFNYRTFFNLNNTIIPITNNLNYGSHFTIKYCY